MSRYRIIAWKIVDGKGEKIRVGFHDFEKAIRSYNDRLKSGQIVALLEGIKVIKTNKSGNPLDWKNPQKIK